MDRLLTGSMGTGPEQNSHKETLNDHRETQNDQKTSRNLWLLRVGPRFTSSYNRLQIYILKNGSIPPERKFGLLESRNVVLSDFISEALHLAFKLQKNSQMGIAGLCHSKV